MSETLPASTALEVPKSREILDELLTLPGSTGQAYSRFHDYSPRNIAFLAMQGCPPEPVATFKKWQELGRQVQRGQKAYSILRPIQVKIEGERVAGVKVEDDKLIRRFKVVKALFAYSQTAGEELPPYEPREWSLDRAMAALAIRQVPFASYNGNVGGFSIGRDIAINPVAPYPLRTALHEIAHVQHGHTTDESLAVQPEHRGQFEFEAEASAYVCLQGLDALDDKMADVSRGYVQGWLRNEEPSETSIRKVLNVSTEILKAGREVSDEG